MSKGLKQFTWQSKEWNKRRLELCRPCSCGCDFRDGINGVGYIIGNDSQGNGFSIWIDQEDVYQAVAKIIKG